MGPRSDRLSGADSISIPLGCLEKLSRCRVAAERPVPAWGQGLLKKALKLSHGQNGGSPLILVLDRQQPETTRENVVHDEQVVAPDNTAVRVALWRALHVEVDSPPHVLEDEVGLKLAAPDDGWRNRPDMSPFTRPFRASIVARARFIEDLVAEQAARGVGQYVILGAGLDTFAQRRLELSSRLLVFEIDRPGPQAWKR